MKKEDLIKLAGDKNFTSKFIYSRPYKNFGCEKREKTRFLLWMTELQEWLRDKHNLHIQTTPTSNYEEVLSEVLYEALRKI